MVLQAGEPAVLQGESFRKGTAVALEGYKAVIAKLAGENLVNLQRVGIIGFSRTCDNVMYAVTQAPSLFAAATIANGFTYSVMGFLEMVDATTDNAAMKQWSLHYGGNPLGAAIEAYKRENVLFNLHQVATPIRVETHDSRNILTDWETYAGLRSLNKPVDLGMLPYSTHVVSMPSDVVDIAIELEARMTEDAAFRMWCDARRKLAVRRGTHFNSTVDLVLWPRTEIFRALRARARALSLHEWNQVARIPGVRYRILMGDRERIVSLITGGECVDA